MRSKQKMLKIHTLWLKIDFQDLPLNKVLIDIIEEANMMNTKAWMFRMLILELHLKVT